MKVHSENPKTRLFNCSFQKTAQKIQKLKKELH